MNGLLPFQRIAALAEQLIAEGHAPDAIAAQMMVAARHLNDRADRKATRQRIAA